MAAVLPTYKIIVVGDSGVGKTAIIRRYIDRVFHNDYLTTIGIDHDLVRTDKVCLSLWDTAGQERFRSISTAYIRDVDVVILVFDITERKTFDNLPYWFNVIKKQNQSPAIYLTGNKTDLIHLRSVASSEAKQIASEYKCRYTEVTAKNYASVVNLFETIINNLCDEKIQPQRTPRELNYKKQKSNRCCA